MISFLYTTLLAIGALVLLPKYILRLLLYKDRTFFSYFVGDIPERKDTEGLCFLLYAVSVGEAKAVSSLFARIQDRYPRASIFVACRTLAGKEEAQRGLPNAAGYFLLPLDFAWNMRRLYDQLRPDVLIISEGDLWYHQILEARKRNLCIALISAKISERSFQRFKKVPAFSRALFSSFSVICAQNTTFAQRFIALGALPSHVFVTGNLKMATLHKELSSQEVLFYKKQFGITEGDFVLVVGSTHAPEEEEIVRVLYPLWKMFPYLKCFIVPRHASRFAEVDSLLSQAKVPYARYLDKKADICEARLVCVDAMGILTDIYQMADVAIVAGSFCPSLRGHNIIEPLQKGVPVIFGPYMSDQTDFVEMVLSARAGIQVDLSSLADVLRSLMHNITTLQDLADRGKVLMQDVESTLDRTAAPFFSSLV